MLLTVIPLENPGPPSPVPPPTAPKPKKDNARLQRLIRKSAKKSAAQPPPTQSPKAYRSTLSPVNEGDLESPEPTVVQKPQLSSLNLPPRFHIRGSTHRVHSPYPKQHSFTFTVVEQHSLSQYLSPSPVSEIPSPCTAGSSTHDNPFLFPPGGSASDHTSLRINANASPRPNTPRHVSFNPNPPKQPVAPLIKVSDFPAVIVPETDLQSPVLISINIDETLKDTQSNTAVLNAECGHSTIKSLPDQQEPSHILISCSPVSSENKPAPLQATASTPEVTKKSEDSLRATEISCNSSTVISEPKDINQTTTQDRSKDEKLPLPSEVKTKSLSWKVTNSPKITPQNSETDVSTSTKSPNTEEVTLLKTPEKPKPPRKKPGGGWARLMKHLVVEPEEPNFPEPQKEGNDEKTEEVKDAGIERTQQSKGMRANKMWDALLYHMATSTKGQEKAGSRQGSAPAPPLLPFLRSRLPLLLHRPRFDARKLKEAASRPLRKVTAFFHRRITEKESATFNRTASGWSLPGEDAQKENVEVQ